MIQIEVVTYNGMPPSQPLSARFDELGGNIGRAEGNTLVLPDPGRSISRIHASISFQAGQYFIRGLGSTLPVYLNDQALSNTQDTPIVTGDRIRIGDYMLQVVNGEESGSVSNSNPRDDLFTPPGWSQSPGSSDRMVPDAKPGSDFDPFDINRKLAVSSMTPPSPDFDPFADLFPEQPKLPDLKPASPGMPDVLSPAPESKERGSGITHIINPKNPLVDPPPSLEPGNSPVVYPSRRDDVPEWKSSLPLPRAEEQAGITPPVRDESAAAARPALSHEELLHAFLAGAGVPDLAKSVELTPQLMSLIGQLLRESTQGTLDLLQARMLIRKEMRADMTMIAPKENNPLKFSPNVEAALDHLLAPKVQGFMAPLQAMKDSYDDLRSHQFGFMAGMRAALSGVLECFNPNRLEQRLMQKTVIDSLFPANRKAKLWGLFTERYSTISQEAQEDFHIVFGKEFLRAYEAQVAKLEKNDNRG